MCVGQEQSVIVPEWHKSSLAARNHLDIAGNFVLYVDDSSSKGRWLSMVLSGGDFLECTIEEGKVQVLDVAETVLQKALADLRAYRAALSATQGE